METARFQQLEDILEAVWQVAPEQQSQVLDELCGDDGELRRDAERLLGLDSDDSFLETPPHASGTTGSDSEEPTLAGGRDSDRGGVAAGDRIGNYQIVRPLGSGGMGSVYLARRHDGVHRQDVAIKVLTAAFEGPGALERFSAEREILAHLSHPNIASLLDGGTTPEGRPYLVMEWVDGVTIDRYCERHELSIDARLELFQKVCAAVQEAHRSLIVHRDLKPANILVDGRGEPKLLDFGIAKLLRPDTLERTLLVTDPGSQPMTPAYASPEQVAGGQITTAVDVYALGILLYELLTGQRPYELSSVPLPEAIRRICVEVPPKPSSRIRVAEEEGEGPETGPIGLPIPERRQLVRLLRGDLDSIVSMALRKEPERRYASVESLREDLQRYLGGLPVTAADDSLLYRLGKFARRHRTAVASTLAGVLLFVSFTVIVLVQRQQVRAERDRATFTSGFLLDLFTGVDPWSVEARDPSAAEMLDRGTRALEARASSAPDVRADLLHTMGRAYAGIGRYAQAEGLLRRALELRRELSPGDDPSVADSLVHLAASLRAQGRIDEGLRLALEGREMLERLGLAASPEGITASLQVADSLDLLGSYREAEATYRRAVETASQQGRPDLEAIALHRLGQAKRRLHLYDEAKDLLEQALAVHLRVYGERHPRTARTLTELGTVRLASGDVAAAERDLAAAAVTLRDQLGAEHPQVARVLSRQGHLALDVGDLARAEQLLGSAESILRTSLGEHPQLAETLGYRSSLRLDQGLPAEAEAAAAESLRIFRALFGERHVDTAGAEQRLALAEAHGGRAEQARARIARAVAMIEDLTGADSPRSAVARAEAARIEVLAGRLPEAEAMMLDVIDSLERFHGRDHTDLAKVYNNLAMVRHRRGELERAEDGYRTAIEISGRVLGESSPLHGAFHTNLARLLVRVGKLEEATGVMAEGGRIFDRAGLAEDHLWRLHADRIRAKIWIQEGRHDEVEALLAPWLEHFETRPELSDAERRSTWRLVAENFEVQGRRGEAEAAREHLAASR